MAQAVVIISGQWRLRAALRAELIEEGYLARAFDSFGAAKECLGRIGFEPCVVLDLSGGLESAAVLDQIKTVVPSDRMLVLTSRWQLPPETLDRAGVKFLCRPFDLGQLIDEIRRMQRARS